jgi:hypothetical protein
VVDPKESSLETSDEMKKQVSAWALTRGLLQFTPHSGSRRGGAVIQSFQNTVAGCGTRQACLGISDEMKKQVSALALPGV